MAERVRICDIAEELGLSTATVSNVIHGKTGKVSAETAERVTALLEEWEYIPSMAGIRVPEDISVAGFDDTPICEMLRPALTTVRQDGALRAGLAVEKSKKAAPSRRRSCCPSRWWCETAPRRAEDNSAQTRCFYFVFGYALNLCFSPSRKLQ